MTLSHLYNVYLTVSAMHGLIMQAQLKQIRFFWLYEILVAF